MEKNFQNFSAQDAMKLAKTQAGQQLIQLLQQQNSTQLQTAMDKARSGDYAQAKQALSNILNDPKARALLSQLGRENDG